MTKLLDVNVWLAIVVKSHVHHVTALAWFSRQKDQSCAFCWHTQLAFLRLLTNSRVMGSSVQTQTEAWTTFDALFSDPRVTFERAVDVSSTLRQWTQRASPSHALWSDAYLAALAKETGDNLVSFDSDFARFPGLLFEQLCPALPA